MPSIKIDAGGTFLPLCSECGWRGLPSMSRGEALQEGVHHEQRAHYGDRQAADALHEYRKRHTGR